MPLDAMVTVGPVYVRTWRGKFRCVWTPMDGNRMICHGIGVADTPYAAMSRAQADAREQGWA